MRAYEFPAKINAEGTLELPESLAAVLAATQVARVILLIPDATDTDQVREEDAEWHRFAAEQLLRQYDEADEIYDRI